MLQQIGEVEIRGGQVTRIALPGHQREQVPILDDEMIKASLEENILDGVQNIIALSERPADGIYPIFSMDNGKIFKCELSMLPSCLKFPIMNINPGGQCINLSCRNKFESEHQCVNCLQAYCSQECRVADAARHTNGAYSFCKWFHDISEPFLDRQNGK